MGQSRMSAERADLSSVGDPLSSTFFVAAREQWMSGAPLLLGTMAGGLFAWAATTLTARVLGAPDFGLAGALLGLTSVVAVVLRPIHSASTHAASAAAADGDAAAVRGIAGRALAVALVALVGLSLLELLLIVPLSEAFHVTSDRVAIFMLLGLFIDILGYGQVVGGLLLGLQRYRAFAGSTVVDAGIRLLSMLPLAALFGVAGALAGYALGALGGTAFALVRCGGIGWRLPRAFAAPDLMRVGGSSFVLTLAIAALQNVDLVALRTYRQTQEVGWYAAAATIANVIFSFSAPLYLPVYPRLVAAVASGSRTGAVLAGALVPIAFLGGGLSVIGWLFGPLLIESIFGGGYAPAGRLLPLLFGKTTALLVLFVIGQYAIAVKSSNGIVVAVLPAAAAIIGIAVLRQPAYGTAGLALAGSALAVVAVAAFTWFRRLTPTAAQG
jgi:O-antigen/teichoic acid export membrane protein